MASSKRRPYLGLKRSLREFFTDPVRWIKEGNRRESIFEKPYLDQDYRKMHLDWSWPDWPSIGSSVDTPSGQFGDLSGQNVIVWTPGLCWLGVASCRCGESFELNVRIVQLPPHISPLVFAYNVWSDTEGVEIESITPTSETEALVRGRVVDEDFSGVATICGYAQLVSGQLVNKTYWEGRPREFSQWTGVSLEEQINKTIYFDDAWYDCGCTMVSVDCLDCATCAAVAYDDAGSDDTIARNNSATVAVTGGCGPFSWTVSGTGFTLDSATTSGLTNTLNADGTACGTAKITVTDACENTTDGFVQCTTGAWNSCMSSLSGGCTFASSTLQDKPQCRVTAYCKTGGSSGKTSAYYESVVNGGNCPNDSNKNCSVESGAWAGICGGLWCGFNREFWGC